MIIECAPSHKEAPMLTIKAILAPTDFSDLSQAGVRYAVDLAIVGG